MYTDQEIWDMDYKYIPQQQYLLNPFAPGGGTQPEDGTQPGGGGGGGIPNAYNYDSDRTSTAARMPNQYIDYLDKNRNTGKNNLIEKGIGLLKNTFIGQGLGAAKGILQDIMPMNQTAIMNNEMLGQGFAVDNTGKLVRVDQGDVDTAGNIMAGHNVSKMDEETFDDRIDNLKMKLGPRRNARIAAIKAAKAAWMRANVQTGKVYHDKYKDREDYRMLDTKVEDYMKNKEVDQSQEFDGTPSSDNVGYNEPGPGADHGEFGPASWMIADGGMVKDAPRRPFFYGGLARLL